ASWLGVEWHQKFGDLFRYDREFLATAARFELGYYVELNLAGMRESAAMFRELGTRNIQRHTRALIDRLADYIRGHKFYRITSSMEPKHRSSIFTFTCDRFRDLHKELYRRKITCVHREGSIRISVHFFNNEDDIDKLIAVLDRFAESAP
ncbi:MAG TPA: aminotransferase class V-fold PLP-dependent enzyme, partial [candidate division Zixibacteria bacterium]|nr:aminotransferase class V-fold PLP-dependent enzyme [candidate division Zixibacteria bacterium]